MRTLRPLPFLAVLALASAPNAMSQVTYPDFVLQNGNWTNDTRHFTVTNRILSPGIPGQPLTVSTDADVEFVSATQVHLTDGFHAGNFTNNGHFRAYINSTRPDDVVAIAPDPSTHVVNNVMHVEKWEKLEIGLRLPQEYQDAIDRFFAHYYSKGLDSSATPEVVNAAHDLNPYADDSLQLVMRLTSPSGAQRMKWGFFMREARWSSADSAAYLVEEDTSALHDFAIRFRFAPDTEGVWQLDLSLEAPNTSTLASVPLALQHHTGYSFVCDPPLPDNKGYLHVNTANRRTLQFDTGENFFGLGTNLADKTSGPAEHNFIKADFDIMQQAMGQLHSVGGNFLRMFLMKNSFAPEWVNLGVYDRFVNRKPTTCQFLTESYGNGQYQCWSFDKMLDSARVNDIYIQLCIDPYPPIRAYESTIWHGHSYALHYLDPSRDTLTGTFDVKRFFYSKDPNGNPDHAHGVFYYWKRKYKYIMARWGYSVNIAAIEPFNEVDQLLTYRVDTITNAENTICPPNRLIWPTDSTLPATVSDWVGDIADFVRQPVDTAHPVTSSLGESNKLFLMSFTDSKAAEDSAYYKPLGNPKVDLIDVHRGFHSNPAELSNCFDYDRAHRDANHPGGNKKPFHNGECNYYAEMDLNGDPNDHIDDGYDTGRIFHNYDVSFHNEIWATTFFGNFAAGTTWAWQAVYWWEHDLPVPKPESLQQNPDGIHTRSLWATNILNPNGVQVSVQNRPCYHNFKPLADLLANPDWQAYGFFNGAFDAHKVYDETNPIEAYYLTSADQPLAIGWVHNLNAWWKNQFYVKNTSVLQNFFGCTPPSVQQVTLTGLQPGLDYHITWFPTRMNDTIHPANAVDTSGTGTVVLDMSTAPLGDTANKYLDTLHVDYAFIISPQPVHRSMHIVGDEEPRARIAEWDYTLFPNPANDQVNVVLPDDELVDIAIYDVSGRWLSGWNKVRGPHVQLPVKALARGAYYVRVSANAHSQTKHLILH